MTGKTEATRLADALDAYGETTQAESNLRAKVSALLRRWPDGEPVAWLVEGWHDGELIAHIVHLTLDEAKASAAVFSQHYTTTKTAPLYTAPPAKPDACPGRPDSRCHYLARCGDICNKCGRVHDGTTLAESERIAALEAALEQARMALEEMQYARTDKAERLTAEALRKIEEVRKC